MANTTNFNWETPDDTDLVKDGAAAMRTLGNSIDTTTKALNPSTTLGDIEYRSSTANTNTRLGIGTTGQILTVTGGVPAWATPAAGLSFSGCSLYKSGAQSVSNATFTALTFDAESYDTDTYHSTSTNTSRVTIPTGKAGKYLLHGTIGYSGAASGLRSAAIYKNGSPVKYMVVTLGVGSGDNGRLSFAATLDLAVNDYVELYFYQASGGSLDLDVGESRTSFYVTYEGA